MKWIVLLVIGLVPSCVVGQHAVIKGQVRTVSGEELPMATITVLPDSLVTRSDLHGVYRVHVRTGRTVLNVSYTGFERASIVARVSSDTVVNIVLKERVDLLAEVVVGAQRYSGADIVHSSALGKHVLSRNDLFSVPTLLGERNPIKAIRLLPGTTSGLEGSSDTFVRGGAADQNLVLLDGAPIYNTGHLFGFLSIISPDIVDHVNMISGGFPAEFGGRLSSVLDVGTLSRIADRTRVSADIGVISSRMKLEQPLFDGKAGFWLTGRTTHVDQLVSMIGEDVPYSFYDFNGKIMFHPSRSNQIEVSHYGSRDHLDFFRDSDGNGKGMHTRFHSGNASQTFKWRHNAARGWRNELSLFRTHFDYRTENAYSNDYEVAAHSEIVDYGARFTVRKDSLWGAAKFTGGAEWIMHNIRPKVLNSEGSIRNVVEGGISRGRALHEFAGYIQQELPITPGVRINIGLRTSLASSETEDYLFFEPRLAARLKTGENSALKFSYSRMVQYIHRISNSAISTPIDVWFPVTDSVRPQTAHQYSAAWQRFFPQKDIYFSAEAYYKEMNDLTAFSEGTNFLYRSDFDSRVVHGQGKAYGAELLLRKETGKFTGWISYTLSWSFRRYDALNDGEWFSARYDRRHNGAVVAQHHIGKRWAISVLWEFISGARFTPVVGQYVSVAPNGAGLDLVPVFSGLNTAKLSDSHRLDVGLKYFSKPGSKIQWHVVAGVYNVYNRATPFGIVVNHDETDNSMEYIQPGLFGLLPFLSLGFAF